MKKPAWIRFVLIAAGLALVVVLRAVNEQQAPIGEPVAPRSESGRPSSPASPPTTATGNDRRQADAPGDAAIAAAFREGRSDVWVESGGTVEKLLRDDNDGARHQLLIVRLASGQTVLISHNIDLAERVPAREGDRLDFRGEYEWNDRGGVVHWTHHDPQGRHAGGHLLHGGRTYR